MHLEPRTSPAVVLRKISSRDGFQQVVVMQAAETRAGSDAMSGGYAMSGQCGVVRRVIWKSRTQRGMWSFTVVMRNPLPQESTADGVR